MTIKPAYIKGDRTMFVPATEPRIFERKYQRKDGTKPGTYYVRFFEKIDGHSKPVIISRWDGRQITSREMAEKVKNLIWKPSAPQDAE